MRLLLLRHGEAGFDAPSDYERHLTRGGVLRLQAMLNTAAGELSCVTRIVHSPYLRTVQTADLVQQQKPALLHSLEILTPDSSPQAVIDWLSQQKDESLLLVTHQPLIGYLVSLLCEGDLTRPEPMQPGAMVVIDLEVPAAGLGRLLRRY
ncbi:phosphohistidine phosphatase SixA [Amphritea sp. HPY]|uniref:phosphohistidine phosphatase SixA n=1 Tax=Amphritea sp. HPY TaxID=3421652 RepID=UPI003D7D04FC